ncbi:hypothetical protein ANO14919_130730 [Xylariales sp. No.14919]|nr:hypothetical protein ANO14919_130730 [Xylariales sp. No.14919]
MMNSNDGDLIIKLRIVRLYGRMGVEPAKNSNRSGVSHIVTFSDNGSETRWHRLKSMEMHSGHLIDRDWKVSKPIPCQLGTGTGVKLLK